MSESSLFAGIQVLIADDDPVSLRFLQSALNELGCRGTAVVDGRAVLAAVERTRFDLLILDRRMPGSGGAELLSALRRLGIGTPAIATSADLDDATRRQLISAGYADALAKPVRIELLSRAISAQIASARISEGSPPYRRVSYTDIGEAVALLDDAAGLSAVGGDVSTLEALRALLARDLDALLGAEIPNADVAFAEYLHRLRAACRYCGAALLERSATEFEAEIRSASRIDAATIRNFLHCCTDTRAAIDSKVP